MLRHAGGVDAFLRRHPAALRRAHAELGRGAHPLAGGGRSASSSTNWLAHRGADRPRPVLADVRHLRPGRVRQPADGPRGSSRRPLRARRARRTLSPAASSSGWPSWSRPGRCPTAGRRRLRLPAQPERHRPRPRRHRRHPHPRRRRAGPARAHHRLRPAPPPCSPPASATSSTSTRPARPNPQAMVDIIRGALARGHAGLHVQPRLQRVHPDHRLPGAQERPGRHRAARRPPRQRLPGRPVGDQLPPHPARGEAGHRRRS